MKSVRLFVFVLSLLFGLGSSAFAQFTIIGKLTPSSNSVTKVMQKAGCNTDWIFQVLQDSNIQVTQLRHLPMGQQVTLNANSCTDEPPAQTAHMSAIILRMDAVTGQVQEVKKENVVLRQSASVATTRLEGVKRENEGLQLQKQTLQKELKEATQHPKVGVRNVGGYGRRMLALAVFAGLVMGGVSTWFVTRIPKNSLVLPAHMEVTRNGKNYVFTLVGAGEAVPGSGNIIGKYKCPSCSEKNLFGREENLVRHLDSAHPAERIETQVDSSLVADQPAGDFRLELDDLDGAPGRR
jgi:hypothetical protein